MKNFGYIENTLLSGISFGSYVLSASTKVSFSGQLDNSFAYFTLQSRFYDGDVNVYDKDDNLLNQEGFQEIFDFFMTNVIQYSGETYKIYELLTDDALEVYGGDFKLTPKSIDYKKSIDGKIHPKRTFTKGFLTECEYFENVSVVNNSETGFPELNYENPILKVNVDYTIGDDGYVSDRKTTRSWVYANGNYSIDTKETTKYYNKKEAREEGKRRRTNIIDSVIVDATKYVVLSETGLTSMQQAEAIAVDFLDEIEEPIDKYIKGNKQPIIDFITSADTVQHSWLTNAVFNSDPEVTIQEFIISELSGGTIETSGLIV